MPQKTDAEVSSELVRKGHLAFSWQDLDSIDLPTGISTSMYRVGDPGDVSSPYTDELSSE